VSIEKQQTEVSPHEAEIALRRCSSLSPVVAPAASPLDARRPMTTASAGPTGRRSRLTRRSGKHRGRGDSDAIEFRSNFGVITTTLRRDSLNPLISS